MSEQQDLIEEKPKLKPKKLIQGMKRIAKYLVSVYGLSIGNNVSLQKQLLLYGFPLVTIGGRKYASKEDIDTWVNAMIRGEIYEDFKKNVRKKRECKKPPYEKYFQDDVRKILRKFDKTWVIKDPEAKERVRNVVRRMMMARVPHNVILFAMRNMFQIGVIECGYEKKSQQMYKKLVKIKE